MVTPDFYPSRQTRQPARRNLEEATTLRDRAARQFRLPATQQPQQRRAVSMARDGDPEIQRRRVGGARRVNRQSFIVSAGRSLRGSACARVSGTNSWATNAFLNAG